MGDQRIHRVPVTDRDHRPVGVLSVDDLTQMVDRTKKPSVDREFIHTFPAICGRVPPRAAFTRNTVVL